MNDLDDLPALTPPEALWGPAGSTHAWLIAHGVAWVGFLIVLVSGVRAVEVSFRDFGIELPWVAALVIKISHMGIALVPLLLVLLGIDWCFLNVLDSRGKAEVYRGWSWLMLAAPLLLSAAAIAALAVPFFSMDYLGG